MVTLHLRLARPRSIPITSFWANQLRLLLTAAAYVLMQELRLRRLVPAVPEPRSSPYVSDCSNSGLG